MDDESRESQVEHRFPMDPELAKALYDRADATDSEFARTLLAVSTGITAAFFLILTGTHRPQGWGLWVSIAGLVFGAVGVALGAGFMSFTRNWYEAYAESLRAPSESKWHQLKQESRRWKRRRLRAERLQLATLGLALICGVVVAVQS